MKFQVRIALLSAAMGTLLLPAYGQSATPTEPPTQQAPANPGQREKIQQERIAQGVKDGQLTSGEAAQLEKDEARLAREARRMKQANGGKLTPQEYRRIERQENAISRQISRDTHNSAVQNENPKSEVGKRLENQQDRIGQGVKSGSLTPAEAARLERQDARIAREVRTDRAANGGTLTNAERAQVNRQENRVSRQIYHAKHNQNHR